MSQIDRSEGLVGNTAVKAPVRLASTANVPLKNGLLTIDGVVTVAGDRVLLKNQTTASENGIWVADTGDWLRAEDFNGPYDVVKGTIVFVTDGSINAQMFWEIAVDVPIVGSSNISFISIDPTDLLPVLAAQSGASLIGDSQSVPVTIPYLQTVSEINAGREISIFRFIPSSLHAAIRGFTNATDLQTYVQNAFTNCRALFVPYGQYYLSAAVNLVIQGFSMRGEGRIATQFFSTVNNAAVFAIPNGMTGAILKDFTVDRTVTAIVGGNGITQTGTVGQCLLDNIRAIRHQNGLSLQSTDYSTLKNIRVELCQSVGVFLTNSASDGAAQWQLENVLSQNNNNHGILVQSAAGPSGFTPGNWSNVNTFANNGSGIAFVGLAGVPINDIRINGAFLGNDGASELYVDSYGGSHVFTGVFSELCGRSATGVSATPASNVGSGFEFTSNNTDSQLSNCHAVANSYDGFYTSGTREMLTGCVAKNNGQQATAGRRNGINNVGGIVVVSGGFYGNTAGVSQTHGVFGADGNNISVVGADLSGNSTATTGATANAAHIQVIGCLPNTQLTRLSGQGGVTVGGALTGGDPAAGVIGVAGGLTKNGTAYTNP